MDNQWTQGFLKVELPLQNVSHRPRPLVLHIRQDVGIQAEGDGDTGVAKASNTIFG